VIVIISPDIVALYCFNGFSAGPLRTFPFKSNALPWQEHVETPEEEYASIMQLA